MFADGPKKRVELRVFKRWGQGIEEILAARRRRGLRQWIKNLRGTRAQSH